MPRFWEAIRGNLDRLEDARDWWEVCRRPLQPIVSDRELLAAAAELLPPDLGDEPASRPGSRRSRPRTGRKGKALFQPLRLALTGREHGPELQTSATAPRPRAGLARLRGETA